MADLTEVKTIKVDHDCKAHPIYLCWLNSLGGYSYWLFDRDNETKSTTKINTAYFENIVDLETATSTTGITGKRVTQSLQIGAEIKQEDMSGIRGLYESSKVFMLANPLTWQTDGVKWQDVIIKQGSLIVLKTNAYSLKVKLTLDLSNRNTQQQ